MKHVKSSDRFTFAFLSLFPKVATSNKFESPYLQVTKDYGVILFSLHNESPVFTCILPHTYFATIFGKV